MKLDLELGPEVKEKMTKQPTNNHLPSRPIQNVATKTNVLQKPNSISKPVQKPNVVQNMVPKVKSNTKSLFKPNTVNMNGSMNGLIPTYKQV